LLSNDEVGDLANLTITFRSNQNGGTHAIGCRYVSTKAADAETVTLAAFRAADPAWHPCRECGGGAIGPYSATHSEQIKALARVWEARLEQEREDTAAQRRRQEQVRRADAIDECARWVVDGWDWHLDREKEAAGGYPAGVVSAAVTCPDCDATSAVTFEPRALRVCFTCPRDSGHGFLRRRGEDHEPLAAWGHDGRGYIAIALVAQILAGDDNTWTQIYGARADDYRATTEALAAFDAGNPEPMRLTPDVRCGECGDAMSLHEAVDFGRGIREEASYACATRHADGRYRHYKKDDIDIAIDSKLLRLLRRHPSWVTAPEVEPSPAALAQYAEYLTEKIATYDAHVGAACKDRDLFRQRAQLADTFTQVTTMRDRGALAVAGLSGNRAGHWYLGAEPAFTDLARALLTTRVQVTETAIAVSTPFDAGTPLYRTLRAGEIREELADLERRQKELTEELAQLTATE
jgi:hypothetical protein